MSYVCTTGDRFPAKAKLLPSPPRPERFWAHAASYQMGTRVIFPGVKLPGSEADNSPQSNAKVKNVWSYLYHPSPIRLQWGVLG